MARILISAYSNVTWTKEKYHDSFVEGFINALKRCGNEILSLRVNDFVVDYSDNLRPRSYFDENKILQKVRDFNPELIIVFNNTFISEQIVEKTNCPIACFASDSPSFFRNKDLFKKHSDRYYFFNFSNDTIKAIPQWFDFVPKDRLFLFGQATDLRAENIPQDINISFIGSIGNYSEGLVEYFKNFDSIGNNQENKTNPNKIKDDFFETLDKFRNNPLTNFDYNFPKMPKSISNSIPPQVILMLTCKERFEVLSNLTDLGLKIFGYPCSWAQVLQYNYELFRCYDYNLSVSLKHSTLNYNRSKISLNLPHGHAQEGFSWRVCDILASNAVLLSNRQPDLIKLTKDYIDLPTYQSSAEARELAMKLLKDDIWRKELSLGCQKMIDEKCRFEDKFKIMEEAIPGIYLFSGSTGNLEQLDPLIYVNKIKYEFKNFKVNFKVKRRMYKQIIKDTIKNKRRSCKNKLKSLIKGE